MDQRIVLLTIVGMALVTVVPRVMPLLLLTSRQLPRVVVVWLRYVPAAVLAAMLFPALLIQDGVVDVSFSNPFCWVGLVTFAVTWRSGSFFGTVLSGVGLMALWRYVV